MLKKLGFVFSQKLVKSSLKTVRNYSAMQEQQLSIKGQTINYLKTGDGNKTILCWPGALGTIWSDFKPQITQLDRTKFTIIAWDPPGYGQSRPPSRKFTPDFYKNDAMIAQEFMQQLGYQKYSLLGWSDGGISSLILAAAYPEKIENLIIWGANSFLLPADLEAIEKIRDLSKWSDKMKAPLIRLYTEEGLKQLWNNWCDTIVEIYRRGGDICGDSLDKIQCPTLILHGDKDPVIATEHPGYLAKSIKGAKLYRFPDGKHNIHLKYAEEFNRIISAFILDH